MATWRGARGQITTMGMLLDPLADKLMIAACYITLLRLSPEIVNVWVVVLIIGREFLVSGCARLRPQRASPLKPANWAS